MIDEIRLHAAVIRWGFDEDRAEITVNARDEGNDSATICDE